MRLRYYFSMIIALLSISIFGQTIAGWDLTGVSSPATTPATTFSSNLVSTSGANLLTRGSGAAASTASNSFRTTGFQNNGISTSNTDYFQITLSATSGNKVSLSSIDARLAGTSSFAASPGVSNQFAYSLDGTNFTLIGSPSVTVGTPATFPTLSLTSISQLQDVVSGTTITLRYYASGQTTTGGWGFNSPSAGILGLDVKGTVVPAAAPPTITSSLTSTATFNTPYSYTVTASNTPTSFFATGLPTGLAIDTLTGIISGTPASGTASGTPYAVTLTAKNVNGTSNPATLNLTVNKANQTITFNALANVYDTTHTYKITASASSGLPLTFSSSMPGIAAIVAPDSIDPISAGMTIITASQAGDADYNPATNVDQNLTVINSMATPQTISFTLASPVTYGDTPIKMNGAATSGLSVSYSSSNTAVAVIVAPDTLKIVGVGSATITASQAGNSTYAPAPDVMQTIVVNPKPLSVINAVASNKVYDGTTTATITGASLSGIVGTDVVTLSAANANFDTPDVGTMKTVTTNYTLSGANASNYTLPSQPAGLAADITQASQTITFPVIPILGITSGTYTLNATASSGLPVTYTSSDPSVVTVSGSTLTIVGLGMSTITASQVGNSNYAAATDVTRTANVVILPVMYTFGTAAGTFSPTSGTPVLNLNFGDFSQHNSLNVTTYSAINTTSSSFGYSGSSGLYNLATTAKTGLLNKDSSAYFEVTITPSSGYYARLDSIKFGGRSTGSGPKNIDIYSNKDNYSIPIASFVVLANSSWTLLTPMFDTITNGNQPITLRIYGYNGTSGSPLNSSSPANWRVDDISIKAIAKPLTCTPPLSVNITGSSSICSGSNTLLTATGATTYLWESNNSTLDTLRIMPTTTSSYIVRGYSATGGCYEKDTITVTVNPTPTTPTGAASQDFCASTNPTAASLTVTPPTGASIVWYDAASGGNVVPNTNALIDGMIYHAEAAIGTCTSPTRTAVTANVTGNMVMNSANSGPNSLRAVVGCAITGDTIKIDGSVTNISLTESLLLDKDLLIEDIVGSTVTINIDFTGITTFGIGIEAGKIVTLKNLILRQQNNIAIPQISLIQVDGQLNAVNLDSGL